MLLHYVDIFLSEVEASYRSPSMSMTIDVHTMVLSKAYPPVFGTWIEFRRGSRQNVKIGTRFLSPPLHELKVENTVLSLKESHLVNFGLGFRFASFSETSPHHFTNSL